MVKEPKEETSVVGVCKDLGMAAYAKMNGYKLLRRRGREFDFEIKESEQEDFRKMQIEYLNSQFSAFDSEIMNLKKLPEK